MLLDLTVARRKTPLGDILLVVDGDGVLRAADFADCEDRLRRLLGRRLRPATYRLAAARAPVAISRPVDAYFDGELGATQNIPISLDGSACQEEVWEALRKIEPGCVTTYAGLAREIGRPEAARSATPTPPTRSVSSSPAIALSARTATSQATAAA